MTSPSNGAVNPYHRFMAGPERARTGRSMPHRLGHRRTPWYGITVAGFNFHLPRSCNAESRAISPFLGCRHLDAVAVLSTRCGVACEHHHASTLASCDFRQACSSHAPAKTQQILAKCSRERSSSAAHACAGQQRLQERHICLEEIRHGRHCCLPHPSCMHVGHELCQLGGTCLSHDIIQILSTGCCLGTCTYPTEQPMRACGL